MSKLSNRTFSFTSGYFFSRFFAMPKRQPCVGSVRR